MSKLSLGLGLLLCGLKACSASLFEGADKRQEIMQSIKQLSVSTLLLATGDNDDDDCFHANDDFDVTRQFLAVP